MKYLLAIILCFCVAIVKATPPSIAPVYDEFKLLDGLESEKTIRILWITVKAQGTPRTTFSVSVEVVGNLIYNGPMSWQIDLALRPVCTTAFYVTVPRSDTCALVFRGSLGEPSQYGISTTMSPISFFHNDKGELQSTTADFRTWSDEDKAFMKYGGSRYGDSALGIPAREIPPPDVPWKMPPDSMGTSSTSYMSPLDQENSLKKMKERELCAVDTEYVRVADTLFWRFRGDYAFKKIMPNYKATLEEKQHIQDYLTKIDTTYHDLMLDLRDAQNYKAVLDILGDTTLHPADCPGIYFVRILGSTWKRFGGAIKGAQPTAPCETWIKFLDRVQDTTQVAPPKKDIGQRRPHQSSDANADIFFDGLEEPWNWYSDDENLSSGYDSWRDVSARSRTGSWSAWCAADGDVPIGVYYDNDMYATMSSIFPISLAGYINTRVSFWAWYQTENLNDHFQLWGSANGITWQALTDAYSGSSFGQWENIDIGVISTSGNLYLRFLFYSNGAGLGEGVYIDDIRVYGTSIARPNLTPIQPWWWSDTIVVSATRLGNTSSTVYGGELSYIDFAIINNGQAPMSTWPTATIFIDGDSIITYTLVIPLLIDDVWYLEDYIRTLSTGFHEVTIYADYIRALAEENEEDNVASTWVYWDPPTLDISGVANFWNMNPPATGNNKPKEVRVELRDMDGAGVSELLTFATTTDNGTYSFSNINNVESGGGQQDIFLRVIATNPATQVNAAASGPVIFFDSPVENNLLSGSYTRNIQVDQSTSGAFFIAQTVLDAKRRWIQERSSADPGLVTCSNIAGDSTGYVKGYSTIFISKSNNSQKAFPDTYDKHVIEHEYAHHIAYQLSFFDADTGGAHGFRDTLTKFLAADEAFADYYSCWLRNQSKFSNKFNNFADSLVINLENGESGINQFNGSANNYGVACEGAVAGILWDIFDQANDDYTRWNASSGTGIQDGRRDSLSYATGMTDILTCLLDRNVNGHKPDDMDDFFRAWLSGTSLGHAKAMDDIAFEHGELSWCCDSIRGNADCDANDAINVADVTYLSTFLYQGGPAPRCFDEGNAEGTGSINVVDIKRIVNFLFKGGPPPTSCP